MSRIDDLIMQHCPEGVSFSHLGKVCDLQRGTAVVRKNIEPGDIPVVAGGRKPAYYGTRSNRDGETIVIAGSGAYAGYVSWWEGPIFVSDAFSVKSLDMSLVQKYLYYWLLGQQDTLHKLKSGVGVPHVYPKDVAKLEIPVPPIEVQREIVRILDAFTELEAGLEAELEARHKQYAYYRDRLLTFDRAN